MDRYPEDIISIRFQQDFSVFQTKYFWTQQIDCLLQISFIGLASLSLERNVKTAVENCYSSVVTHVVQFTKLVLSPATKDLQPALQESSVIYK